MGGPRWAPHAPPALGTPRRFPDADLRGTCLARADLAYADFSRADLRSAHLEQAALMETVLEQAQLSGSHVYGIAVWDVIGQPSSQLNLVIKSPERGDVPTIVVDDLEIAQFVYLLTKHHRLRKVLNAVTERGVLLPGPFEGGGLPRLQAIAARLRDVDPPYLPIIFDFKRQPSRTYTETVKTLVGLSRFAIVDLSGPSVPKELDDAQKGVAEAYIGQLDRARVFGRPIVTRVDALKAFYPAEDYHQDFMLKNPGHPYILVHDLPKVENLRRVFPARSREQPVTARGADSRPR